MPWTRILIRLEGSAAPRETWASEPVRCWRSKRGGGPQAVERQMAMSCRTDPMYPQFPQAPVYAWSVAHSGSDTRNGRFDGLSPVLIYCGARLARKLCLARTRKKVFKVSGRCTHGYLVEAIRRAGPRDIGIQVRKCEEDLPTEQAQAQKRRHTASESA